MLLPSTSLRLLRAGRGPANRGVEELRGGGDGHDRALAQLLALVEPPLPPGECRARDEKSGPGSK